MKKGATGRETNGCDKAAQVKFVPAVFFCAPQRDYTKSGTCDLCYNQRENVSLAQEDCRCMVTFELETAFEVILRRGQRSPVGAFAKIAENLLSGFKVAVSFQTSDHLCAAHADSQWTERAEQTAPTLLPLVFQGDVFFYYGLKNFHQNLRRYMDSRDDAQTLGLESNLKVQTVHHTRILYQNN